VNKQCPPDHLAGGHFYKLLDTLTPDNVGLWEYVNLTCIDIHN